MIRSHPICFKSADSSSYLKKEIYISFLLKKSIYPKAHKLQVCNMMRFHKVSTPGDPPVLCIHVVGETASLTFLSCLFLLMPGSILSFCNGENSGPGRTMISPGVTNSRLLLYKLSWRCNDSSPRTHPPVRKCLGSGCGLVPPFVGSLPIHWPFSRPCTVYPPRSHTPQKLNMIVQEELLEIWSDILLRLRNFTLIVS